MGEENEEAPPTGPLSERVVHKTWKWRLAAYEELETQFKQAEDGNGPIFNEYGPLFKKILADSNPAAQEKGLDALLAFIDRCDSVPKHAGLIAPLVVEKGLPARPKAKERSTQALLQLIEADSPEPVLESLLKGASNKNPKISAASIATLREALRVFGGKVVSLKPIMKEFPAWFENRDKTVRTEASQMVVEMYRWIGKALNPAVESLTAVQAKELQEAFEKLPNEQVVPLKYMRSQAPKPGQVVAGKAAPAPEPLDPYDLLSEVNILSKIKDDWFEALASPKWTIRAEHVDKLIELANAPRLEQGDYNELAKALKKSLQDLNVAVAAKAAKAIGLLGNGLRLGFNAHARILLPVLFEKLKEKKIAMMVAVNETLDILAASCFLILEAIEDITAACANKVPQVREGTLNWLTKAVVIPKQAQQLVKCVKPLCNMLVAALDDGLPEVREAAAKTFGAIAGVVGERAVSPYLAKLDPIKAKKVKDNFPQVMPTAAPAPAPEDKESGESSRGPVAKKAKVEKADSDTVKIETPAVTPTTRPVPRVKPDTEEEPKAVLAPKKPAAKKPAAPAKPAASSSKISAKPAAGDKGKGKAKAHDEDLSPKMSREEALAKAAELLPASALTNIEDKNWKQRVAGIEELTAFVGGMSEEAISEASDAIVQQLDHKPGWKESNFQVLAGAVTLIGKIALGDPKFSRRTAAVVTGALGEKLSDIKIKTAATECLLNFTEATCPQFVFSQLYQHTGNHKNPKVTSESLVWMSKALEDFGTAGLDIKMLIDHVKSCLDSTNAAVKSSATKVLIVLRIAVGPPLSDFLSDVKKQLLDSIEKEFDKVKDMKPNPSTRTFREAASLRGGAAGGVGELPRTDISGKLTQKLLKDLGDTQWKTRQTALEQIEAIVLEANRRVEPKLGSLMGLLKARLSDSNQKICTMTLYLIGLLANAVGPAYDKSAKIVIPAVLAGLADNKKPMRDASLTTLDQLVVEVGLEAFMTFLPPAMLADSSLGRKEVLQWMMKYLPTFKPKAPGDMKEFIKPLLACVQDKQGDVRHLAESVLGEVVKHVGVDIIKRECKDLKPASQQLINPIIEKLRTTTAAAATLQASASNNNITAVPSQAGPTTATTAPTTVAVPETAPPAPIAVAVAPVPTQPTTAATFAVPSKPAASNIASAVKRPIEDDNDKVKDKPVIVTTTRTTSKLPEKSPSKVPARSPSRGSTTTTKSVREEPSSPSSVGSGGSGGAGAGLFANDLKEERKLKERKLQWAFDNPRPEFTEVLAQQAQGVVTPSLHSKMFSTDYRQHQKALDEFIASLETSKQETIDNLDILLKWCTLRLFDSNATSIRKTLGYLEGLLTMLAEQSYRMSDYEAHVFIPLLIERSGANSSDTFRTIFRQLGNIFPSSKMFAYVMAGLKSKNWRTKVECLNELASVLNRQGLSVCIPAKAFPLIAQHLADKDPSVRSATLNTFLQAFLCAGEELWKHVPSLPENHKNMLEAHIKREQMKLEGAVASPARPASSLGLTSISTPSRSKSTGSVPGGTPAKSPRRAVSPNTLTPVRLSTTVSSSPANTSSTPFKLEIDKIGGLHPAVHQMPALAATDMPARSGGNTTPRLPIRNNEQNTASIEFLSDEHSNDAQVDNWLQHINDADGSDPDAVIEAAKNMTLHIKRGEPYSDSACDRLMTALIRLEKRICIYTPFSLRVFKYVFAVICQIAKQPVLYCTVTHDALYEVLKFVFELLALPINIHASEDDKKGMQQTVRDFLPYALEGSDTVVMYSVLLRMMTAPVENPDFLGWAVRTHGQLTKRLIVTASLLDRAHTIQLLQDANTLLIPFANSPAHNVEQNAVVSAVKAMIQVLVYKRTKQDIEACAASIHPPAPVTILIQQYLQENEHTSVSDMDIDELSLTAPPTSLPPPSTVAILSPPQLVGHNNINKPIQLTSASEKKELQEIFRRLTNREFTKQGLSDLHAYMHANPHVDISPFLCQTTTSFQQHVKRQLEALEVGEEESSHADEAADIYLDKLIDIQTRCGLAVSVKPTPTVHQLAHSNSGNNIANITSSAPPPASISEIKQRIKSATDVSGVQSSDKENNTPQPTATSISEIRQRLARMRPM